MRPNRDDHEEQEKAQDELAGTDLHQDTAFPRDMSPPGEDGYRTPNAHDYERERERQRNETAREGQTSSSEKPTTPAAGRLNWTTLDKTLEKLHWRERVRHYTWTFFTMTMATGGIANVIHAGMNTPPTHPRG